MKTAKEVLTKYSDGDYTQFKGYKNILLAMQEYAEQYHESRMKDELMKFLCQLDESTFYSDRSSSVIIDYYLTTRKS